MPGVVPITKNDDKKPLQTSAQVEMFGGASPVAPDNTQYRRVRPERAIIKFGVRKDVRRDDGDIPLAKPKQLGLDDGEVDRTELARDVRDGQELSERAILRITEGSDASGQRRKTFTVEVNEAVEAFFHGSQALYGFDLAVCMLFRLLSRAPSYMRDNPPTWILEMFAEEREILFEAFHGLNGDRRIEVGESEDDDG